MVCRLWLPDTGSFPATTRERWRLTWPTLRRMLVLLPVWRRGFLPQACSRRPVVVARSLTIVHT